MPVAFRDRTVAPRGRSWTIGLLLALSVGGCSTERVSTDLWSISLLAGECPEPAAAEEALVATVGETSVRIDGMPCDLDEILDIVVGEGSPELPSCCYAVTCDADLAPAQQPALYAASCRGLPCASLDLGVFSAAQVDTALDESLPGCAADAGAPPTDVTAHRCWYRVTARYSCSTAPG